MNASTAIGPVRAYHASGIGHWNCARIVHDRLLTAGCPSTDSTWIALSHIIGFAAEAALKAYLAKHGFSRGDLMEKPFGHKLDKLLGEAKRKGLAADGAAVGQPNLADALQTYVNLCGHDYSTYNYRYIEAPSLEVLSAGVSTATVLAAIEVVLDIAIGPANDGSVS